MHYPACEQAGSDVGHRIEGDNRINGGISNPMWTRLVDLNSGQVLYAEAGSNNKLWAASEIIRRSGM